MRLVSIAFAKNSNIICFSWPPLRQHTPYLCIGHTMMSDRKQSGGGNSVQHNSLSGKCRGQVVEFMLCGGCVVGGGRGTFFQRSSSSVTN